MKPDTNPALTSGASQADALDAKREGLLATQHRAWAAELRASYARFMSSPNNKLTGAGTKTP